MRKPIPADFYRGYADLSHAFAEGRDYRVTSIHRPATDCAVIAPHGGKIERGTTKIARAIAGEEFSLYLFEGIRPEGGNFKLLHLTSRVFDEPRCLALVERCRFVISVHGFKGAHEEVLAGGLDEMLKQKIAARLNSNGLRCVTENHRYPAVDPMNICNRGRMKRGVQLELSAALRKSDRWTEIARACREALFSLSQ